MFKKSSLLTLGLKELFFDSKTESSVTHYSFNARKALAFALLISSLTFNILMIKKFMRLSLVHVESLVAYDELEEQRADLECQLEKLLGNEDDPSTDPP